MKEIKTNNFIKISSDLKEFPFVEHINSPCKEDNDSPDDIKSKMKNPRTNKKKKKIYQLNMEVDDVKVDNR